MDENKDASIRQGGNYTRPVPYSQPMQYEALLAHKVVDSFRSHQEAESRIRREFQDVKLIFIDTTKEKAWTY